RRETVSVQISEIIERLALIERSIGESLRHRHEIARPMLQLGDQELHALGNGLPPLLAFAERAFALDAVGDIERFDEDANDLPRGTDHRLIDEIDEPVL